MLETVYSIAPLIACGIVLAIAIWKGGPSEQAAAAFAAVGWTLYIVVHAMTRRFAWGQLAIDLCLLIIFAVLVWRSRREWPLALLAFQGVAVAVDVWYLLDHSIPVSLFFVASGLSSFGVLASIAFGIWDHARKHSTPPSIL